MLNKIYQNLGGVFFSIIALPLLWGISTPLLYTTIDPAQFVFLHNVVEIFSVVVAMFIFVTGYHAIFSSRKGAVVILAVCFFGVGLLDLLHMLSYAGMPDVMTANSSQKSIFFWLSARLLAAVALLAYALVPSGELPTLNKKKMAMMLMTAVVVLLAYVGLFYSQNLPSLFIVGKGLTNLKIELEWLIISIDLTTLLAIWLRRGQLPQEVINPFMFAALLSAISELFFNRLGVIDKDSANLIGHLYKVIAYLYLFKATVNEALHWPLRKMEVQYFREKVILDVAPYGVLLLNNDGRILKSNTAMSSMCGWRTDVLVGMSVDMLLPWYLKTSTNDAHQVFTSDAAAKGLSNFELVCRDGSMLAVDISIGSFLDEDVEHTIVYARDLSERKKFERSLQYQAMHDELTDLANRTQFRVLLDDVILNAKDEGQTIALLFLDLDYFKSVNDSFGHANGDALLKQAARRITTVVGSRGIVARLGGDEFAVCLSRVVGANEAIAVANALLGELRQAFDVQSQEIYSSASIGLAFYPDDASDSGTLLRYADMAMYRAKQAGRGTFACYSGEMNLHAHEDMKLHTRLKEALSQNIIDLHYQPQVDVNTGAIVGVEALLRWNDPVLGWVSPARMIPIAEATGLILPLSEWVLKRACEQIAAWTKAGYPLCVAVNFSAQLFRQKNMLEKVALALNNSSAEAKYLCIEITESVAMIQPQEARQQLIGLVEMGCSIALDDFGTGYSSLAYLKTLPISKLKIDKSFMDGIPDDINDVTISRAIIALAHSLGMTLVAEGVETQAQLDFLLRHDCEVYQGWLFAKAMSAATMTQMLVAQAKSGGQLKLKG